MGDGVLGPVGKGWGKLARWVPFGLWRNGTDLRFRSRAA